MYRVCRHCGERYRRKGYGPAPKFCSANCRAAAHRASGYVNPPKVYVPRPPQAGSCARCGVAFEGHGNRRYCSTTCVRRASYESRVLDGRQALQDKKRRKHEPRPCLDCGKGLRIGFRCRACGQALRRTLNGVPAWQRERRLAIFERDGWMCQLCGDPIDRDAVYPAHRSASIDHKVPLRDCRDHFGPDYIDGPDNWQAAHSRCNSSKGARRAA